MLQFSEPISSVCVPSPSSSFSVTEEMLYVEEGELTVRIGDTDILLKDGDSTVVQKDLPHICKNAGDVAAKGISALSPPIWGRMDLTNK